MVMRFLMLVILTFCLSACQKNVSKEVQVLPVLISNQSEDSVDNFPVEKKFGALPFYVSDGSDDLFQPLNSTKLTTKFEVFPSGSWQMNSSSKEVFMSLAEKIKLLDDAVLVTGHTDVSGDKYYNENLSIMRAKAIANYLVSKGVDEKKVYYRGFGEIRLINKEKTKEANEENKRIEVDLLEDSSEIKYLNQGVTDQKIGFGFYITDRSYAEDYFSPKREIKKITPTKRTQEDLKIIELTLNSKMMFINFGGQEVKDIKSSYYSGVDYIPSNFFIGIFKTDYKNFEKACYLDDMKSNHVKVVDKLSVAYTLNHIDGAPWYSTSFNDKSLILLNLSLNKNGDGIVLPSLIIKENNEVLYSGKAKSSDAFFGEKNILVRLSFDEKAPVFCMDILFKKDFHSETRYASLFYIKNNKIHKKEFNLISPARKK